MKNKSFTLIELLVVIVIIGILAGVIMISTSSSISKANFAKAQTFSNAVQEELFFNLISEWTFDEDVSPYTIAKDTWSNLNGVGTNVTHAAGCNGESNGAAYFNGSAYIRITDNSDFNFGSKMSAFVWVKGISQNGKIIFSQWDTGAIQRAWYMGTYNTLLRVALSDNGDSTGFKSYHTSNIVFDNSWRLIGFTWNNGILKVYVNGSEASVTKEDDTLFTSIHNSIADVTIGCYLNSSSSAGTFTGSIDDTKIYNVALTSTQIKRNYIAGLNSMLANGNISKEEYSQSIESLGLNF